jgi:rifampicin phosphotransferase
LRSAERAYPLREENEFYTVSVPLALVRYALLELGQRLAERGTIAQRDDVFFLEWQEALQTLRQGGNLQAAAARRRSERAWAEHNPGPSAYGTPASGLPDLAIFPAEVRFGLEAMIWANESIFAASRSSHQQTSGPIQGLAASSGTYTGPARIIMHEGEFDKLRPGDVMVCPITSPVWSVLFPHIGALVTDTGGLLSHAAIIAREYRVPAVVATGNATRRLQDGQIVSVDGATGIIEAVA